MSKTFNTWIDTMMDEKGIDLEQIIEVEGKEWGLNLIPVAVVIEHMKIAPKHEQSQIKTTLVKIDFLNGDVLHFIKYLAKAIAR